MTYEQKVSRQHPVMSLELKLLASDFFSPFPLFENWQGLRQLSWPRDGSPMQRKQRYHSSLDHSLWDCYVKSREAFFQMGEIIACSCFERIDPWEREKWMIQKKEASISVKMSSSEWEGMGSSVQVNGLGLDRSTDSSFKETGDKTDYIFQKWPRQYFQAHILFQNFATDNRWRPIPLLVNMGQPQWLTHFLFNRKWQEWCYLAAVATSQKLRQLPELSY